MALLRPKDTPDRRVIRRRILSSIPPEMRIGAPAHIESVLLAPDWNGTAENARIFVYYVYNGKLYDDDDHPAGSLTFSA